MKKYFIIVLLCLPAILKAQTEKGIHFEQGLSWGEIQQKAKKENKYIFVDCYATWCGPCKLMDVTVYSNENVGKTVNDKFISVKVQMDKTSNDDENTKKWYNDANALNNAYTITSFPTFLFFSSDGKPLHKSIGARKDSAFITLTKEALNPNKQYYRLLADYKPGILDTAEMKGLALKYKDSGKELSEKIILDYLNRIPASERFSDANLKFLSQFTAFEKIESLAYDYLTELSKQEFGSKRNISFAVAFCNSNNTKVQELCINYVKTLSFTDFIDNQNGDSTNLKCVIALASLPAIGEILANYLNSLSNDQFVKMTQIKRMEEIVSRPDKFPAVQKIIITYLENIASKEWSKKSNITLAIACQKDERFKDFVNHQFINTLKEGDLNSKDVIELVIAFTKSINDPGFELLYNNQASLDTVMITGEKGQSKYYVTDVINKIVNDIIVTEIKIKEYVATTVKGETVSLTDIVARFEEFEAKIKEKYPKADAYRIVSYWKWAVFFGLAKASKVSDEYAIKYRIEYVNQYGPGTLGGTEDEAYNICCMDIFEKSNDLGQLNTAIKWIEGVVERNKVNDRELAYLDTYANLLYKVGRVKEAIEIEPKLFSAIYDKMLKGLPTWPDTKALKSSSH